ncbi:hypothetical protein FIL70_03620 [Sphingobium fuliginis ATCC 27551]|uniref:Uncharacterized protein n=1 Tax=Sphingobium fuliginis ATCC 27551 TaxID=1208342 RepID=A0A5B8CEN0_SPHSA|nr:hypothetical protein FIL70_03620 [Sphingobium fuliginis ATCC 27551]
MTEINRTRLLREIERHLTSTGTAPTRFGRNAANDPCLVFDLRRGRTLRPATASRILAHLAGEARA